MFKWTYFEKRNNLDELINIPTKAEKWTMIEIPFRTQERQAQYRTRVKTLQLIHDPLCFQNPPTRKIYRKNLQSVWFNKAKSVGPQTYSPPSWWHEVSERLNVTDVNNITKEFDRASQNGDLSAWFRLSM